MSRSLTTAVVSLFPPGRRFLTDLRNLQIAVRELQTERKAAAFAPPRGPIVASTDDDLDRAASREIQLTAATHLPLLTGDLVVGEEAIEVVGSAIAPDGLTQGLRFFINGRPFDDVTYPIADPYTQGRFSQIDGAAAFRARATRDLSTLKHSEFFRIDMSPTGAFVAHRWRQAMWFMNPAREKFQMPPAANIQRVIGEDSVTRFGMGGATIFHNIDALLKDMGRELKEFRTILDWGCGAGRITRYLLSGTDADVYGVDIDQDNLDWCAQNLSGGTFVHGPLAPPTFFPDGLFDLVIGASVVTHLTESMQFAWLQELQRITRPGALLLLSVAGPTQFAYLGLSSALWRDVQEKGFLDVSRDPTLDGRIEDPKYYRRSLHSRRYVAQTWSRYFDVLAIVDGIAALQDFVVLRRRAD